MISRSGIRTSRNIERLAAAGAKAAMVGEALLRADNIDAAVRELRLSDGRDHKDHKDHKDHEDHKEKRQG